MYAIEKGYLHGTKLCLELCCGGALLLYKNVLIDIFDEVVLNEWCKEHMYATYDEEDKINKDKDPIMKGNIAGR